MANFYCVNCGYRATSVAGLTALICTKHPAGQNKGNHILYEGSEKAQYTCKYCGFKSATIATLTALICTRHPNGQNKGYHSPTL